MTKIKVPTDKPLEQWSDAEVIFYSAFIIQTVAHMRGHERGLLPVAERMREIAKKVAV